MPSHRVYKLGDVGELQAFLNGAILGAEVKGGLAGLVGQTLTFTSPAFAVTFAAVTPTPTDRDPSVLLFKDIKAQVETANPTISVVQVNGRIAFVEKTPLNGIQLSATQQAAKGLLGFDPGASTGKFFKRPSDGTPPCYQSILPSGSAFMVITWE